MFALQCFNAPAKCVSYYTPCEMTYAYVSQQYTTRMANWVDLVRGACFAAKNHQPVPALEGTASGLPAGLMILRSLAEATALTDRENIRFNLDTAAIYLLRILSESPENGQLA